MTIREGDTFHIQGHPESITGDRESIQLEPVMLCVPSSPQHFDKSETRSNAHQVQSGRADQVPYQYLQAAEHLYPCGQEIHATPWDGEGLGPQY